jgi:hypothetical protein
MDKKIIDIDIYSFLNKIFYIIIDLPDKPTIINKFMSEYTIIQWIMFLYITLKDKNINYFIIYFLFYEVFYLYDKVFYKSKEVQ